jgi:mRNA interferase MazF
LVIIAFISSKIPDEIIESDYLIRKNTDSWTGTGLTSDSVIRLHKLVTIPKSLIKRKLGVINQTVEIEIKKRIDQLFDKK